MPIVDYARDNKLDAKQAFQRFEDSYQEHVTMFDPGLKRMVLDTATAITDAFGHTNKSELATLTRLQTLFRD